MFTGSPSSPSSTSPLSKGSLYFTSPMMALTPQRKDKMRELQAVVNQQFMNCYYHQMSNKLNTNRSESSPTKTNEAIASRDETIDSVMASSKKKINDAIKVDQFLLNNKKNAWTVYNVSKVAAKVAAFAISAALMATIFFVLFPIPMGGAVIGAAAAYGLYKLMDHLIDKMIKDPEVSELEEEIKHFTDGLPVFENKKDFLKDILYLNDDNIDLLLQKRLNSFEEGLNSELTKVHDRISNEIWKATINILSTELQNPKATADDKAKLAAALRHVQNYSDYSKVDQQLLNNNSTENSVTPKVDEIINYLMNSVETKITQEYVTKISNEIDKELGIKMVGENSEEREIAVKVDKMIKSNQEDFLDQIRDYLSDDLIQDGNVKNIVNEILKSLMNKAEKELMQEHVDEICKLVKNNIEVQLPFALGTLKLKLNQIKKEINSDEDSLKDEVVKYLSHNKSESVDHSTVAEKIVELLMA